jgi:hypothetical protein
LDVPIYCIVSIAKLAGLKYYLLTYSVSNYSQSSYNFMVVGNFILIMEVLLESSLNDNCDGLEESDF